jgi:protein ATS1
MKKIDYKRLISITANIDDELKEALGKHYQPVQVTACWETSFVVLSPRFNGPNPKDETRMEEEEMQYDDAILAFGSNDFDLRGSAKKETLPEDPGIPNLVDLPPSVGSTGSGGRRIRLHGGCQHVIAVIEYGGRAGPIELVGWGAARHGQLGPLETADGKPARTSLPTRLPISIPLGTPLCAIKVALGNQHSVLVFPTGIRCWGSNRNGQIPSALRALHPADILELQATWNATFVLLRLPDRSIYKRLLGYGSNSHGQLSGASYGQFLGSHLDKLIPCHYANLVAGSEHILLTSICSTPQQNITVEIWGWGWNEHGNLGKREGLPLEPIRALSLLFEIPSNSKLVALAAGCATSFAIVCSH